MKATAETPLTRLPRALLVWLEGSASTTVETTPRRVTRAMRPPSALPRLELAVWPARLPVRALLQPGLDGRADRVARHPHVGPVGRVVQECLVPRLLAREGIEELALAPIGLVVKQAQQPGRPIGRYSHGRPPLNRRRRG